MLVIETPGQGLHEITAEIRRVVREGPVQAGLCSVHVMHTSASLTIQENADPSARRDLEGWLHRAVPEDDPAWTHVAEGPDDMPSHVRSMLTGVSLVVPVVDGDLCLGTWQGIYLCEHRRAPHTRRIVVTLVNEASPTGEACS